MGSRQAHPQILQHHPVAQVIQHQRLVRLRQPQLPGQTGVPDAGAGRGTGATVITANQDQVRSSCQNILGFFLTRQLR